MIDSGVPTGSIGSNTTNGAGNTVLPGGVGTDGSLQVQWVSGTYNFFFGPGEESNNTFLNALGSDNTGGNLAPASGTVLVDYTVPPPGTGNYLALGLVLNYNNNFGQFDNGDGTHTASIPYTINAVTGLSYFQLGLIYNSNYNTPTPFTVDNIRASIPEPTSVGMIAAGVAGAIGLRRRPAGSRAERCTD